MRVCDIADAYHATGGGIRTYLDAKRRHVRDRPGHQHVLVIPADRDFHEQDGRLEIFGVRSPVIPGSAPYRALLRHRRLTQILDRVRPDVIELANPYMQPRAARSFRRRYGAVLAGFYHTDFPEAYVETTLRGVLGSRLAGAARRAAERYAGFVHGALDLTVTASPALRDRLTGWGVPAVELVSLGVDLDLFRPDRRDPTWRRELGVADGMTLLVYAGRMDREKRPDVLVEMMRFPSLAQGGYMLALMGRGPRWRKLERDTRRDPQVLMLPYEGNRRRLARTLASADVYVSAARHETFGLSVIEAQACGLPVVGQRAGAMIDRVPPETGVLLDSPDPGPLAFAVASLTEDRRRAMGRAARGLVETNHSWEATFERLFDLYARRRAAGPESEHARRPA